MPSGRFPHGLLNGLLEGSFIGNVEMSEEAIVERVLASCEAKTAFDIEAPIHLPDFVRYLVESAALLNPHAKLIHAAALILLGNYSHASAMLDELPPVLHAADVPRCRLLKSSLMHKPEEALAFLQQVREKILGSSASVRRGGSRASFHASKPNLKSGSVFRLMFRYL